MRGTDRKDNGSVTRDRRGFRCLALLSVMFISSVLPAQDAEMFAKFKGGSGKLDAHEVKLPFTIQGSHAMFMDVRLNGQKKTYKFLFDTGGVTLLDKSVAEACGLEITQMNPDTAITSLSRFEMKGVTVTDFRPFVMDFTKRFHGVGSGADTALTGMVGCDLLRFFHVSIDYRKDHLLLTEGGQPMVTEGENVDLLPMEILMPFHPCVRTAFSGGFSLPGRIDTGLHYGVVLPLAQMEKLSPEEKKTLIKSRGNFAKWPWTDTPYNYLFRFKEIRIGKFLFKNQPVIFAELPPQLGRDYVLLGRYFLEHFVTTMDFRERKVRLERIPVGEERSLDFSAGVCLTRKGKKVAVRAIWEGSPADRAGLAVGREVMEINGQPAVEWTNGALFNLMMNRKINKITLVLETGKELETVVLNKENLFK